MNNLEVVRILIKYNIKIKISTKELKTSLIYSTIRLREGDPEFGYYEFILYRYNESTNTRIRIDWFNYEVEVLLYSILIDKFRLMKKFFKDVSQEDLDAILIRVLSV